MGTSDSKGSQAKQPDVPINEFQTRKNLKPARLPIPPGGQRDSSDETYAGLLLKVADQPHTATHWMRMDKVLDGCHGLVESFVRHMAVSQSGLDVLVTKHLLDMEQRYACLTQPSSE